MRTAFRRWLVLFALPFIASPVRAQEPAPLIIEGPQRMRDLSELFSRGYTMHAADVPIRVNEAPADHGGSCLYGGACAIAALPRPAVEAEVRMVRHRRSLDLHAVPVAMSAVVVFVHAENPLESLTFGQLDQVLTAKANEWAAVGVKITAPVPEKVCVVCRVLAGEGKLPPDAPCHDAAHTRVINRLGANRESGAPDVLARLVMGGRGFASKTEWMPTTQQVAEKVASDPLAIGFGPLTARPLPGVKIIPIRRDESSPPVVATPATVQDRSYPLAHYVYWCFAGKPEGKAANLLAFALSSEGQALVAGLDAGFVPLPK